MRLRPARLWLFASFLLPAVVLLPAVLVVLGAMPGTALAQRASQPAGTSFTPQQRQEIIDIVRQALRSDASLLRDAITALQEDEARQKQNAARGAIAEYADALTRTPGDPVAGNPEGDVTLVEFYDVRCPYCRRMVPVMAELIRRDPKLRVVYKDFPILGPASTLGARALLAAQKQGGYGRLHAVLMSGPPNLDQDALRLATQRAGLDWERLQRDMASSEVQARIDANLALGRELDIQGTPAYVIGTRMLPGAVSLDDLMAAVAAVRRGK